jgi:3-oxoacyl-[acyl-carrier protein] reductase
MSLSVLVTGSSSGIGEAVALRLAAAGYDIVVHCRASRAKADDVAARIQALGRSARVLQFDVADRAACRAVLEADIEAHGAYYGVVCNAGLARDNAFPAMTGEDWDGVVHTNLDAFYNVLHPVTMPMIQRRKPGRIVTIASVSGWWATAGRRTTAPPRPASWAPPRRWRSSWPSATSRSTAWPRA